MIVDTPTPDEIEIAPEMIDVGIDVLSRRTDSYDLRGTVIAILEATLAMRYRQGLFLPQKNKDRELS